MNQIKKLPSTNQQVPHALRESDVPSLIIGQGSFSDDEFEYPLVFVVMYLSVNTLCHP